MENDLDFRSCFAEASHQRGDQRIDRRSAEADIERPAQPLGEAARACRSVVQYLQRLARVGDEHLARRRERNMVLVAIKQTRADLVLQLANRPTERRLGDVAPARGTREV
ncbi:hypothetical protein PYV00_08930 [Novosphingobium sp. H3SJ31-1]|uniref:Uncharacterized protein n=1 Tax=Novosphingobium album (ex Liu et al. 2023) TaxID=3031130 RepID=A0ABT5WP70_9SPHN|nr:hypothetical protein [Novosphingobium album (ex Liu et al. 2023)]MDE8651846.1 hypothetical protein [Novosphingobium album (ex Liu et al. 2023)]